MILITGGMGFIGLHTARCFLDAGEPVVLTRFRAMREPDFIKDEIGRGVTVETLDVADGTAVRAMFRRHGISGVVHLAVPALRGVTATDEFRTNMDGLLNILEAAREAGVARVSLASSVAVYTGVPKGPFREEMPLRLEPGNATEAYKKAFELLGLHYAAQTDMDVIALRIAGIYGPLYHSMANLPSRLTHAAVRRTTPDLASGRDGVAFAEDESDLCYVKDCARGIQLLHMAPSLKHRIYNLGAGVATTNRELVAAVNAVLPGAGISIPEGRGPRWRQNAYMDITRAREDAGYEPQFDVYRAIADYAEWLRHDPE